MPLRIGLRAESSPAWLSDDTLSIVYPGEGTSASDFSTGVRRILLINCRADDSGGTVHALDPRQVLEYPGGGRLTHRSELTPNTHIADIEAGGAYGQQHLTESGYAAHLIIEHLPDTPGLAEEPA